jgi:hypothetical protein
MTPGGAWVTRIEGGAIVTITGGVTSGETVIANGGGKFTGAVGISF